MKPDSVALAPAFVYVGGQEVPVLAFAAAIVVTAAVELGMAGLAMVDAGQDEGPVADPKTAVMRGVT